MVMVLIMIMIAILIIHFYAKQLIWCNHKKDVFISGDALYCAVCLYDVSSSEKVKQLPKCNHCFHGDCIDAWLLSHSSCPLCRHPVSRDQSRYDPFLSSFHKALSRMGNNLKTYSFM